MLGTTIPGIPTLRESNCTKPSILIDLNSRSHFEITFSLIHFFDGGDLPYFSVSSPYVVALRRRSKLCGAVVSITPDNVLSDKARERIISHYMSLHNHTVLIGRPAHVDLTVRTTEDPHLASTVMAFLQGWRNNDKIMLIVHNFKSWWLEEPCRAFGFCSRGVLAWNNVYGLSPQNERFVMPTFFPFPKRPPRNISEVESILCFTSPYRRDVASLSAALHLCADCKLKIMQISKESLPLSLRPFRRLFIEVDGLEDDETYHLQFQRCTYMLPLLSSRTNPQYLEHKLSSSITYGLGFDVPFIAHAMVKAAYPMITGHFYTSDSGLGQILTAISAGLALRASHSMG